jgi:hypothetical protein
VCRDQATAVSSPYAKPSEVSSKSIGTMLHSMKRLIVNREKEREVIDLIVSIELQKEGLIKRYD